MPRKTDSNNPADWLFIARSEMEALHLLGKQELGYSMCRSKLAEVLEKILKAELLRHGWFLERTHDLERLRKELGSRDAAFANLLEPLCTSLAEAYVTGRYPGFDLEDPDWPGFRAQLDQVAGVLEAVCVRLSGAAGGSHGGSPRA